MIIVPLLEVRDTVLVAISTLVDQWNFFSVLMELKDAKGENVFNVYRQQLVCARCMNRRDPGKCTHNDHMIPPWKSKRQVETARLIFGDDTAARDSESLGLVGNNTGSVFPAKSIKALREAPLYNYLETRDAPPKFVFVACDPNAGGPDHTAIVAIAYMMGRIVVRFVLCVCWVLCLMVVDVSFGAFGQHHRPSRMANGGTTKEDNINVVVRNFYNISVDRAWTISATTVVPLRV